MNPQLEYINKYKDLIKELYSYIKDHLGFEKEASIVFILNEKNSEEPLGKTAYYSPQDNKVAVYINKRHIKDILRSIAHELIHHDQHCRGQFNNVKETTQGYAQNDDHLREMERQAYEYGNMMFRDFEDNKKKGTK